MFMIHSLIDYCNNNDNNTNTTTTTTTTNNNNLMLIISLLQTFENRPFLGLI